MAADRSLPPEPSARDGRCTATTKRGNPCPHAALPGSTLCRLHTPGDERRRMLAELGRAGARKVASRRRAARAEAARTVALATAADMRQALEKALARVEACNGSAISKALATARIVSAALQVLQVAQLEAEVASLRALVEERLQGAAQ